MIIWSSSVQNFDTKTRNGAKALGLDADSSVHLDYFLVFSEEVLLRCALTGNGCHYSAYRVRVVYYQTQSARTMLSRSWRRELTLLPHGA